MFIDIYYTPSSVPDTGQQNEGDAVPALKKISLGKKKDGKHLWI